MQYPMIRINKRLFPYTDILAQATGAEIIYAPAEPIVEPIIEENSIPIPKEEIPKEIVKPKEVAKPKAIVKLFKKKK